MRKITPPAPTAEQRLAGFTQRLIPPMVTDYWARDMAERLLAYDPTAESFVAIRFLKNDRIVVDYKATGERRVLTFVVPRWMPPIVEQPAPDSPRSTESVF